MEELFAAFHARPAATDDQVASAERALRITLPPDFIQSVKRRNGGEGLIGQTYVTLWDVSELGRMNRSFDPDVWAPGLLLFGTDGGNEGFGFDTRDPNLPIVQIPLVGMCWGEARPLGNTFNEFLENVRTGNLL
ncbi:SMI1/KNR4 family protein [Acidobacteria bacterium AB60]|nr:SMI1/KNR4 family protein [Acidobacteria bacterium AB60]